MIFLAHEIHADDFFRLASKNKFFEKSTRRLGRAKSREETAPKPERNDNLHDSDVIAKVDEVRKTTRAHPRARSPDYRSD
ncbi:hypothetical protein [Bradyrhizobium sp. Ash2021]|uniref:hypothetical protein n=1 Tax=Bradyrhizobium sp. Ash2021 TaxID=2954771 RepID=UPI0028155B6D|nr:hypothetical protein [Bradyrhizobium sp. Ash2021]WMT71120.1 hypothetical protein NL528_23760 [Bradyrhizobium sp. Ash2021]